MKSLAERVCVRLKMIPLHRQELAWQFAKEGMQCSRSKLTQYLNGKYPSECKDLEERLELWLKETQDVEDHMESENPEQAEEYRKQVEKQLLELAAGVGTEPEDAPEEAVPQMGTKPEVFESDDYINVVGICNMCQQQRANATVVGQSGYGKTYSLKQYARLPKVIYIECNESMSCRDLIRRIEKQLGLPKRYGTNDERMEEICEFFNINQGYLMIVDEADKLINKYTIKKIEVLRTIRDSAAVGLVLAGELSLESYLVAYDDRFAKRMDFAYRFHGLTEEEIRRYLNGWAIEDKAMDILIGRAMNSKNGCFRLFDRTLNNIIRIMKEKDQAVVTEKIIGEASAMMML